MMRSKSKVTSYDLGVVSRLDRVNAPKQARSAESLERILAALEHLLRQKSFDEITMADIEKKSGCGLAAIYARFRNKNSILAALHETTSERFKQGVDMATDPERWKGRTAREAATVLARGLVNHYSANRHLMRAGMLLGDKEIYERAASLVLHAASRIQAVIARPDKASSKAYQRRLDLGTSAIYALLQQRLIFYPIQTRRFSQKDDELAEDMADLLLICAELE
jgi:AcrR family transcriptional regulator